MGERGGDACGARTGTAVRVERGEAADYLALERWHYRAGPPATSVLTLRAMIDNRRAGVLVVSMPTLNGRWRQVAWPEIEWSAGGRVAAARRLNGQVRTISRVIVAPCYRGTGVAGALVRAYLASPLSERTESIAAMGAASPFFERAGMRRVELPLAGRDVELKARLHAMGVRAWELVDVGAARRLTRDRALRAALERWASGSRATRSLGADPVAMAVRAAGAICGPRAVFVRP